jgi:RNA polymerase sigma-70 factor (ECF subfamily)
VVLIVFRIRGAAAGYISSPMVADPFHAEFAQHGRALRRLAAALVGDQHADDVLQDAALAALRTSVPAQALASWLRRALALLAGKHHRAAARRRRHESRAAVPAVATASDAAEHADLVRKLDSALLALPEPYRGALLQRYFADRSPGAIAADRGVPVATVKSHLQRGLAMLRERFAAERSDWRAGLGAVFGIDPPRATAIAGVLAMGTVIKLALGAAGLAAAAGLWWWSGTGGPSPIAGAAGSGRGIAIAQATADGAATRTPASALRDAAGEGRTSAPGDPLATVRGRCIDELGAPLADVQVALTSPWVSTTQMVWTVVGETRSIADGAFVLRLPPPEGDVLKLCFSSAHRVPVDKDLPLLRAGAVRDCGDQILVTGCDVTGRVVDTNGEPVPDVGVLINGPHSNPSTAADAAGAFAACVHVDETYRLRVPGQLLREPTELAIAAADRERRIELVVEAAADLPSIRGTVVDENGLGLARVEVATDGSVARSRADGSFVLLDPTRGAPAAALTASRDDREFVRLPGKTEWGTKDLRITVPATLAIELRVVDAASGRPFEDFAARIRMDANNLYGRLTAPRAFGGPPVVGFAPARDAGHHPGGALTIPGLRRTEYEFRIEPLDPDHWPSSFVHVDLGEPLAGPIRIAVSPVAERTLRLRSGRGEPVAGCHVQLAEPVVGEVTANSWVIPFREWHKYSGPAKALLVADGTTDANGELLLRGLAGLPLVLRLLGPGCVPTLQRSVRLDGEGPLEFTVDAGARLRVRTLAPEVLQQLEASPARTDAGSAVPRGPKVGLTLVRNVDGRDERIPVAEDETLRFGRDGTLDVGGIPAGTWGVHLVWPQRGGSDRAILPSATFTAGQVTETTIDLAPLRPCTLHLRVLADGEPVRECGMTLECRATFPGGRVDLRQQHVATDAEGRLTARGRAGSYRLFREGDLYCAVFCLAHPDLLPGATLDEDATSTTGTLRIRYVDAEGKAVAGVAETRLQRGPGDWLILNAPPSDGDGRVSVGRCGAGSYTLCLMPRELQRRWRKGEITNDQVDATPVHDLQIGVVVVAPGDGIEQEVRLPAEYFR